MGLSGGTELATSWQERDKGGAEKEKEKRKEKVKEEKGKGGEGQGKERTRRRKLEDLQRLHELYL